MSGTYGSAFSSTDPLAKAPGATVDAGDRLHRNVFNFADAGVGGTTNPILLARVREGQFVHSARLSSDVNVSGINVTIGPLSSAAKYVAAAAGPNATTVSYAVKSSALDDDPLAAPEDIYATPSGNWPAAGTLVSLLVASKR